MLVSSFSEDWKIQAWKILNQVEIFINWPSGYFRGPEKRNVLSIEV